MTGRVDSRARLGDAPGFWTTWTAATVSGFGSYVTSLAVGVLVVITLDGGATEVGLVNAARWLPYLLLGLVAGVVVDRVRRRPLLVTADLGRGVLLLCIPLLASIDRLHIGWLLIVMTVFGLLSLIHDAAFQAFVPRLVPPALLTAAHARLDQSDPVAQASGPALAGGLVSLVGAPLAVLVDAVSFLVSGLLLWRVRVPEPPSLRVSVRGIPAEVAEGLRWVYRHATLRAFAVNTHAWFLVSAMAGAVVTPFALRTLGLSPFLLGLALALAGLGALLGSLAAVRLGRRFGVGRVVVACRLTDSLAWSLIALSAEAGSGWALFGAGQLVFGLGLGASNANEMGYRQTVTPDRLQGRMNATMRSINRAMIVIGAPLGGVLGDAYGLGTLLWFVAAGFLLVAVALGLSRFRHARLDDVHPH
ncbi:MAG: MFS transporter [Geodermatophilaceae bacterium]|nr:MFS transporter [Geodermatophilaceae bacterium]